MFDVVTFGETMIRLTPAGQQRLEQADSLAVHIGGSESNTATALAILGRKVTWWSRLPANPLGRRIESTIRARGVDTSHVIWDSHRAGIYFLELSVPPRAPEITYDRADSAASHISRDDVDVALLQTARHLHITGITAALSLNSADAVRFACESARRAGNTVSLDVNFRRKLWSAESARRALEPILKCVDMLIAPIADAAEVFGTNGDADSVSRELHARYKVPHIVVTAGAEGAVAFTENRIVSASVLDAGEVDRVGAGDAFDAGMIDGFLDGDLERGLRFGCAMAALKRTIPGDMLFATRDEIESVAAGGSTAIRR
jgi:2-dehydro-3-deoxygluconokinase